MERVQLFNDHFQNYKVYGIPKAQLIIADIPYNVGKNADGSNSGSSRVRGANKGLEDTQPVRARMADLLHDGDRSDNTGLGERQRPERS